MNVSRSDLALLALRLVLGAAFVEHGLPKIGHLTTWTAHVLPVAPPWLAAIAALVEFAGGIAVLVGFGTPIAAFAIGADMVVAIFFVLVPRGAVFVRGSRGGPTFELELAFLAIALALVLLGSGEISVDALRGRGRVRTGGRSRR